MHLHTTDITIVHKTNHHPKLNFEPFSAAFLRAYISRCRAFEPAIPKPLTESIVASYVALRKREAAEGRCNRNHDRFCPLLLAFSFLFYQTLSFYSVCLSRTLAFIKLIKTKHQQQLPYQETRRAAKATPPRARCCRCCAALRRWRVFVSSR
jgi:hypothetical protein